MCTAQGRLTLHTCMRNIFLPTHDANCLGSVSFCLLFCFPLLLSSTIVPCSFVYVCSPPQILTSFLLCLSGLILALLNGLQLDGAPTTVKIFFSLQSAWAVSFTQSSLATQPAMGPWTGFRHLRQS